MPVPRNSLRSFLVNAKAALQTAVEKREKITFVIGNESADLDSFTCSILFAYIRSSTSSRHPFTQLYVPVTNMPASGLNMRPEFQALFPYANIEPHHVITLNDLPDFSSISTKLPPENTKWILVDHNALQGTLGSIYSGRVAGVIDHHEEENKVSKDTGDEPRIITKAGSCSSLIIEYCRDAWDSLSIMSMSSGAAHGQNNEVVEDDSVSKLWDAQVAHLALASILIDTYNLTSKEKTTDHDIKAAEYLEAKIMACPQTAVNFDKTTFFEEIDGAKRNIDSLQLHDVFVKDYKEWEEGGMKLGISSVVKQIDYLQNKAKDEAKTENPDEAFISAARGYAEEKGLDIYAIMTTSTSPEGQFQRELLVWAMNPNAASAAKKFAASASEELGLEDWSGSNGSLNEEQQHDEQWRKVWWQRSLGLSRKQVAPLLRQAML